MIINASAKAQAGKRFVDWWEITITTIYTLKIANILELAQTRNSC